MKVQETETVAGYELDGTPKDIVIREASVQELTFRGRKLGTLVIKAQDSETKEPIPGAEFKVTYANGQVVDNANGQLSSGGIYTTDENGEITIYGVTGTLVVTEEKTIPGYSINPNGSSKMVEVNTNDTQTLVFTNDPLQALTIQKFVTGTTTGIQGAVFLVTDSSGEVLGQENGEFITDQHGRIVLDDLKPGDTITVKEIRAAAGYALDDAPQSIKIKQGAAQKLTFFNAPLQSLTLYKYVEGTTTPLPGVTFLITDTNGNPVGGGNGQYVTDSNGKIVIEGLTPGMTVVAREIKTVKGYVHSDFRKRRKHGNGWNRCGAEHDLRNTAGERKCPDLLRQSALDLNYPQIRQWNKERASGWRDLPGHGQQWCVYRQKQWRLCHRQERPDHHQ